MCYFRRQPLQLSHLLSDTSLEGFPLLLLTMKEVIELVCPEILLSQGLPKARLFLFLSRCMVIDLIGKEREGGLCVCQLNPETYQ